MNLDASRITNFISVQATQAVKTVKNLGGEKLQNLATKAFKSLRNAIQNSPRIISNIVTLTRYGSQKTTEKLSKIAEKRLCSVKKFSEEVTEKMEDALTSNTDTMRNKLGNFYEDLSNVFTDSSEQYVVETHFDQMIGKGGGGIVFEAVATDENGQSYEAVCIISNEKIGSRDSYNPESLSKIFSKVGEFLGDSMPKIYDTSTVKLLDGAFKGEEHPQIVMEKLDKLSSNMSIKERINCATNLVQVLGKMEENGFVHGDLGKPNIMCRTEAPEIPVLIDLDDLQTLSSYTEGKPENTLNNILFYDPKTPANNPPNLFNKLLPMRKRARELMKSRDEWGNKELKEIKNLGKEMTALIQKKEKFNAACAVYTIYFQGDAVYENDFVPQNFSQKGGGPDMDAIRQHIDRDTQMPPNIKTFLLNGFGI